MLSPLLFAVFAVPVFQCNWLELIIFWLPAYIMQDICLRVISGNTISLKWSGIYETSITVPLFFPVLQETFGVTMSQFNVTDKSNKGAKRKTDWKYMFPVLVLTGLSVIGIIRVLLMMNNISFIGFSILLFWLIRNLYFLVMTLFLIDGREIDDESVKVIDAEPIILTVAHGADKGKRYEGVTTLLTEHKINVFLDEGETLKTGTSVRVTIDHAQYKAELNGQVTDVMISSNGTQRVQTIEILDYCGCEYEYFGILYDRVPTLPQSFNKDFGILTHLWQNIAHRVARTRL